ncbi:MAG: hypothetical protein ACYC5R_04225, partial [Melioribacteraceae bacterium]
MARLYKLQNGYYYIYYRQEDGRENKISTKTKKKSEAQEIYEEYLNRSTNTHNLVVEESTKIEFITLGKYTDRFLEYSRAFHSPKTTTDYQETFKFLFK